jgi:ATP-dependent HslUV protease ATP-binding subunit HslU
LEELSFEAADMKTGEININAAYVKDKLEALSQDEDLSRFIL